MHCNRLFSGRSKKMPVKKIIKYSLVREKDIFVVPLTANNKCILGAYSEPSQTSKMKLFAEIINGFQLLSALGKSSILDIRLVSEYTFAFNKIIQSPKRKTEVAGLRSSRSQMFFKLRCS